MQVKQFIEQTKQSCPVLKVPFGQFEIHVLLKNTKDVLQELHVLDEEQPEQVDGHVVQVFVVLSW